MPSKPAAGGAWGLPEHPTVWTFAGVILFALIVLALLRHFFGSIKVDLGTK
jgi:hypothetical protein